MLMSTGQMPMMGMMGPGIMPMIMSPAGMMGGMMGSPDYVEGRLAFLKTELKITDAQMPQWNAFADALRANAKRISDLRNEMIGSPGIPMIAGSALERFERMEKFLSSHLESVRTMKAALQPLYAVLSDDQKKTTDALIYSPMGMM